MKHFRMDLALLADLAAGARSSRCNSKSAVQDAFKLYDTWFPFDLTEDYASEQGMTVDREGFDAAMEEQRDPCPCGAPRYRQHEGARRTAC